MSGVRETVADPDREREAWAEHFRKISETRGQVADRVWSNVTSRPQVKQEWLGAPPSEIELHRA
eukprot:12837846-Alexandrium_andersonii.AAC.1